MTIEEAKKILSETIKKLDDGGFNLKTEVALSIQPKQKNNE